MLKRVLASAVAGAAIGVAVTVPAYAAPFTTTASNLNIRSDAFLSASVVKVLAGPTSVEVDCQKSGDSVTVGSRTTTWWAHLPAHSGYATVAYIDTPGAKLPGVPDCPQDPPQTGDVTLADVQAMFGSRIANPSLVQTGLPSLNQAMRDANINTARRKAAFLATLVHESRLEYNIREIGDTRLYGGRGYIQLTGDFNYGPAGRYFGIDLLGNPELARSLQWSAPIARWYWTVARNINPYADALDMGRVNAAIGYPAGSEDTRRCDSFKNALRYLTGSVPSGVKCTRPAKMSGDTSKLTRTQFEALTKSPGTVG
ncbi:glycoside hydrolase family 19 [Kribbella sandramycini]|uniref:Glycoside hydrolase family 19 n=1 Tax=Kribbella sandramycini TaxID=60450 RepID=A0A7Y4P4Y6_9ACTN|nr:glycoside hydrolase family 19 protein [Kribbella sandramycini]MBB6570166.1 putative chitinase [Kribbella sandramycini]NOL45709.1 glycoside hydrolase family 19 [Kribbella sandramycini]